MPSSTTRFGMKCRNDVLQVCDGFGSIRKEVAIGLDILLGFDRPGVDAVVNPVAWNVQFHRQLRDRQEARHASWV